MREGGGEDEGEREREREKERKQEKAMRHANLSTYKKSVCDKI